MSARREFLLGLGAALAWPLALYPYWGSFAGACAFQQTTGIEHFSIPRMILRRCNGLFYRCANGAEARRFNRLLIDAGLINRS